MNLFLWDIRYYYKKIIIILFMMLIMVLGSACSSSAEQYKAVEVLSQKVTDPNRTQITVLVKYAFSIQGFEKAVEEKFPMIDLVQVGNYTKDMGIAEYQKRMEQDDLPDMVMTWPLEVGQEYWEDRLIDLSGMNFTGKYNLSILNSISKEGKLYYLPGPAQVRGIVYNKTLFAEKGWEVPKDFEEFVKLCKEIEKSGIRSIQLGFGNGEVLDTAFIGFNFGTHFSKPQDVQWLVEYKEGKGSFGDHFDQAIDTFIRMKEEGIWKASDLDITYSDREKMLFTRQCAMVEDSILLAGMGFNQTGCTDEFALMPFFDQGEEGDWARLYMVCYIGLNKHLEEPANKEKYELVLKLMEYISTPEGQEALAVDTGAMVSNLSGVAPPNIPEIEELQETLKYGRYGVFPNFEDTATALRKGLAQILKGEIDKEELIAMIDEQNKLPAEQKSSEKLGTAIRNFDLTETGNFITDAMAAYSGCEIALFLDNGKDGRYNGKGVSGRLYLGDITKQDIQRVLPDLKYGDTGTLNKITMSGKDLIQTLEYAIPVNNNECGWFYYFSGLKMEYEPAAEAGERIRTITTADGSKIEPNKMYSIAVMDDSVPEKYVQTCEKTNVTIAEILEQRIRELQSIAPKEDERFKIKQ